jgi:hypothetical protein
MLSDRPDAAVLLELLEFDPPDWRRYYDELFDRFPVLAGRWIQVDLWNMPTEPPNDQREVEWMAKTLQRAHERQHRDMLMVAELRGLAMAVTAHRGAARRHALAKLDRRLAHYGLRPLHPGGSRLTVAERPKVRAHYDELRAVIDEVRSLEQQGTGEQYRLAVFIRFPFFTPEEQALIYAHPYPRRGATADAAMAVLARRLAMSPASLSRYLFPRTRKK